jgi:ABC-type nitrate/sulfonate/bicarbonate transport system substrate-binding protein
MTAAGLGLWAAITIAVAGPATSPEYLPLHVAQAEGYFAAEKLEVTLKVEPSERDAAEALAHGRVTIAATSLDAAYRLGHVKGSPPPLIFGLTAAAPVAVLLSPNHKDTIHSPGELRGQPVGLPGVGTPEQAMLATILSRAGVKIHQVPLRSFSNRGLAAAVAQGDVAAGVMADPWLSRGVEDGTAFVLADLRSRAGAARWLGAETVHAALFVRADGKPEDEELEALARALLRAVAKVTEASAESLASVLPASVTGPRGAAGQASDFALRLAGARQIYLPRGRVTEDMLKASVEQARERSPLPAAVKLPWWRWGPLLLTGPLERAAGAGETTR